jgi:hypothetical protein
MPFYLSSVPAPLKKPLRRHGYDGRNFCGCCVQDTVIFDEGQKAARAGRLT